VVALVESPDHVCCRYRLAAFRPFLAAAGHTLETHAIPAGLLARASLFRSLRSADLVILQRKLLPRFHFSLLRRAARRLAFDVDDAVWLRDSYAPKGLESGRRFRRFVRTVGAVDHVIAGNRFLADAAARHGASVSVIPTCVEPAGYPVADHRSRAGRPLRLVWVGSSSTLRGLEQVRETLDAVAAAVPGVRLRLICDRFADFGRMPVEPVVWAERTEAAELAEADVGISWVPDDDWSRGKCGLKVLQYQAAGLPVIANPVGVHPELVRPGETGFLARSAGDWVAAVLAAVAPSVRAHFGSNGRRQVEAGYSVAAGGRLWVQTAERVAAGRAGAA
jgi:glycosyltransferase involved in cell wall biosynthesis